MIATAVKFLGAGLLAGAGAIAMVGAIVFHSHRYEDELFPYYRAWD